MHYTSIDISYTLPNQFPDWLPKEAWATSSYHSQWGTDSATNPDMEE